MVSIQCSLPLRPSRFLNISLPPTLFAFIFVPSPSASPSPPMPSLPTRPRLVVHQRVQQRRRDRRRIHRHRRQRLSDQPRIPRRIPAQLRGSTGRPLQRLGDGLRDLQRCVCLHAGEGTQAKGTQAGARKQGHGENPLSMRSREKFYNL